MTVATTFGTVEAEPYAWPYNGEFSPASTALINIDWQVDFCGPGGYVDRMGYDLNLTRSGLAPTAVRDELTAELQRQRATSDAAAVARGRAEAPRPASVASWRSVG